MAHLLTIARFTVQEAISRRLILAAALLSLVFIGLYALGFWFLFTQTAPGGRPASASEIAMAGTMLTVLGLYAVYFLSSFVALFLTVGAISSEIDSGTLHAVLARPIRRADVVLGRWLAYAVLVSIYVAVMAGSVLGVAWLVIGFQPLAWPNTVGLMVLCAVLLLTLSLLGSTMLSTLANGIVSFTLFGLAWLGGIIELIGGLVRNDAMLNLGIVLSLLVPSDATWKAASFYAQSPSFLAVSGVGGLGPFASAAPPAPAFVAWALAYPLVCLFLAVRMFGHRDL